jgi:hypothetical protein
MKRILSLGMLFCFLTSSASAATPDEALNLLILGNQKYVLENSLEADLAATIIVDPAMEISTADIFSLPDSRLKTIKADSIVLDGRFTPIIIVLGPNEENVWNAYREIVEQSPSLVQAVLKEQTSVLGATVNDEDGAVSILGTHPDLMVMTGQSILDTSEEKTPQESSPVKTESVPEPVKTPDTKIIDQASTVVEEAQAASGGGTGFLGVILVIAAIIGVVILMDKTVLKA